jgi:hypothetical protein
MLDAIAYVKCGSASNEICGYSAAVTMAGLLSPTDILRAQSGVVKECQVQTRHDHWITSSARAISEGGTVRPSAFAKIRRADAIRISMHEPPENGALGEVHPACGCLSWSLERVRKGRAENLSDIKKSMFTDRLEIRATWYIRFTLGDTYRDPAPDSLRVNQAKTPGAL